MTFVFQLNFYIIASAIILQVIVGQSEINHVQCKITYLLYDQLYKEQSFKILNKVNASYPDTSFIDLFFSL